jgi:phage I-like protein
MYRMSKVTQWQAFTLDRKPATGRATPVVAALSIALAGDEPPTEFRIFSAGVVDTVKGKFTFDEASAASVMKEYAAHGIDVAIDYDHAMLGGTLADPALAGRAAGWFNLEVRGGELWAVNVRWTEPAAAALRAKEWRFMSPAFQTDDKGRITSLLNVAITNLPATRKLEPLMAASVTRLSMTLEEMMKVAEALDLGPDATLDDFLAKIGAMKEAEKKPDPKPADPKPAEMNETDAGPEKEEKEAVAASISHLTRIAGKDTIGAAVAEVEVWRASHLKLEAETQRLARERAALELAQRKENAVKLTKLGAETPHTTGLAKGKLCARLLSEPLDEQNDRVAALLAAKGGKFPAEDPKLPPSGGEAAVGGGQNVTLDDGRVVTLSAREVAMCAQMKIDVKSYAAKKPSKKD